jgi:glycosyltransferase involved in cell wall biosynthesis
MDKIRVLYISYDGITDPLGQSQVLPYLVELSLLGYDITILSSEKPGNFMKNKDLISQVCVKYSIKWQYIFYTKKPPVLSTIKDVRAFKKKTLSLHKENNFSIIHCRSYIAALVGAHLKSKFGIGFIFDMRGFWADERIDGGIWNMKIPVFKWVYSFFKKKEREYLLNADASVSLTHNGKKEILSWEYMKGINDNISVIPCCADLNHFNYEKVYENQILKVNLGIPEENYVICYLGSVGTWYMMEEMLDYFKVHLAKFPKSTFLWITKDSADEIMIKAKKREIESNIIIKGSERDELPRLLSICTASIFFIKPLYSKKASSPTKMAELLGMGIPLICNAGVGDTEEIIRKEEVGIVIDEFNKDAYKIAVEAFQDLVLVPQKHLRDVAEKHFSLEEGVKRYEAIYKRVTKKVN